MTKLLSEIDIQKYHRDGVHFPVDCFSREEASAMLARFEAMEGAQGGRLPARLNQKPHLLFPWLDRLIRDTRILDPVEDLLGPNLLCWSSQFFAKNPRDPSFVSWHQDATYWGLSSPDVVTAWVALTPSVPENGCMRVVPGTHRKQVVHRDTFAEKNLLLRGQEVAVEVDEKQAVDVTLQPGQMSLHHVLIVHGSEPNLADFRRVGYAIRYVPTSVFQRSPIGESAMLVRGVDNYRHFEHEVPPESDLHPAAVARHTAIIERQMKIIYAGSANAGRLNPQLRRENAN